MSTNVMPPAGQPVPPLVIPAAPVAPSVQRSSFLLFHGFFFMEFQDQELVVASPSLIGHVFKKRDQGNAVQDWDGTIETSGLTKSKTAASCPPEMLQFKKADIGLSASDKFITDASLAQCPCAARLPMPKSIIGLRQGPMSDFFTQPLTPGSSEKVAGSIRTLTTSGQIALIIALEYDSDMPFTRSYFAQHNMQRSEDVNEVNKALDRAREVFTPKFDLSLAPDPDPNPAAKFVSRDKDGSLPLRPGITEDDEKELSEIPVHMTTTTIPTGRFIMREQRIVTIETLQVVTCPIFGVQ